MPSSPAEDDPPPGTHPAPPPSEEPEYEHGSFTFEGQIERLQHFVVGVNRRGGPEKRFVQILVVTGIAVMILAWFSAIFWGIFIH